MTFPTEWKVIKFRGSSHQAVIVPMTDPWCCYIWCSMDPIFYHQYTPVMLALIYQHQPDPDDPHHPLTNMWTVRTVVASQRFFSMDWFSRENLNRKPWFLPSNIGVSCKFSHHPILWFLDIREEKYGKVHLWCSKSGSENEYTPWHPVPSGESPFSISTCHFFFGDS